MQSIKSKYTFKSITINEHSCKECETDIFTLLMGSNNIIERNQDFKMYLESNENYDLLNLFENKVLNIQHIPEEIKKVLFDGY